MFVHDNVLYCLKFSTYNLKFTHRLLDISNMNTRIKNKYFSVKIKFQHSLYKILMEISFESTLNRHHQ